MLWQRRSAPEESSPALELRSMAGLPGRLSFAEGYAGNRMVHAPCSVCRVDHGEIAVCLNEGAVAPPVESAVILEVASIKALVQCFTTVATVRGSEVLLRTPARPHVVQRRRFSRVDVFLSITLHTPDRPIEAVPAQMINLSIDGAAIVLVEALQPGTPVTLNLTNLGFHPPAVEAVVRRCTPNPSRLWVIGLQFQALQPEQELYLAKYLQDFVDNQAT